MVLQEGLRFGVEGAAREADVGAVGNGDEVALQVMEAAILELGGGGVELQHVIAVTIPELVAQEIQGIAQVHIYTLELMLMENLLIQ